MGSGVLDMTTMTLVNLVWGGADGGHVCEIFAKSQSVAIKTSSRFDIHGKISHTWRPPPIPYGLNIAI